MSEPEGGLYPWQGLAVAEVMASLKENPCLVAPTGGGKTSMAAELARILDRRTVFVAHRNEILDQAHARLRKAGVVAGRIQTGEPIYPQLSVQVASKDKLHRRPLPWKPELFIVDECFPAGTPISVPGGSASIEDIRIGDEVVSFDEASGSFVVVRVSFVFRKRASALLRVRAGGADVFCTPGHPFFTQRGWVQASLLTCGDMVLTIGPHEQQALPFLRDGLGVSGRPHALVSPALLAVQAGSARKEEEGRRPSVCGVRQGSRVLREVWAGSSQTREGVLLGGLHEGLGQEVELQDDGGHEPPMRFKEDEAPQSHEASRGHGEDEGQVAVHGVGSQGQRWPRKASSSSAGGHGSCSWVAGGGHRPYEDEEVG